jgi:mannose-1-phosphate guanylyltransferase
MYAVIMAGGEGTRFWPVSRQVCPKPFLSILGSEPLIVQTVRRLEGLVPKEQILVLINRKQHDVARRLLGDLPEENLILEPRIRDTAPCIGLAAEIIRRRAGDQTMVCLPSDHIIHPADALRDCLRHADACAESDPAPLYTIGIRPTYPATGYGYILRGQAIREVDGEAVYEVLGFHEKPALAVAEAYFDSGDYFWNSGIFFWRTDAILEAIRRHQPELAEGLQELAGALDGDRLAAALARVYPRLPRISVDYGILEKADQVRAIEGHFAWDDIGTWQILTGHLPADECGNVAEGPTVSLDASHNVLYTTGDHLVAALGVSNLIVVSTPDATLVTTRDQAQRVKELVARLKDQRLDRYL